jgi:putative methionine-R-sulfoxide reductase with GAF domain
MDRSLEQDLAGGVAGSPAGPPASVGLLTRRYGTSLLLVAPALILTLLLRPLFPYPFFFLFFPAVMGAAWLGGRGPGIFAVLLSTIVVDYFLVPPLYSLVIKPTDLAYFAAFVLCSLAASWVSSIRKAREERLLDVRDQLEVRVAERTAELDRSNAELQHNERGLQLLAEVLPHRILGRADDTGDSEAAPLEQVLARIVEFASSVVKCDSCLVYVLEDDELILRASKNPHPEVIDRLKLKVGQGITGWVAEHRQPVSLEKNASEDPRFRAFNELPEDRFEAFLSVPILSRGRLAGVINLQNRSPYRYDKRDIRVLSTIGLLVGAEIEMARLESENSRLSNKLEARKLVERAKGIVQRELRLNEEQAYLALQRESRRRGKSMKEIAEAILLNDDVRRAKT